MKTTTTTFLFILLSLSLLAQKAPKFGKIEKKDLEYVHTADSSADAVVLLDRASTTFRYSSNGFEFSMSRLVRIKIINKDGYKQADIRLPYQVQGGSREKIVGLKGITYNLENGSLIKSKLEKASVFDEKTTEYFRQRKFTMPDVKEGSVIEYKYDYTSPFLFNLPTWDFQATIPTLISDYTVTIPEYFEYQLLSSGYETLTTNETSSVPGSFRWTSREAVSSTSVVTKSTSNEVSFQQKRHHWVAKDVPAFKAEAFMTSAYDFYTKIDFELRGEKFPNQPYKEHRGTWDALNKSMNEHSSFGMGMERSQFMKKEIEALVMGKENDEAKISAIASFIRQRMSWNGNNARYMNGTLRKAYDEQKGNVADINMLIVAALRIAGIEADAALVSTRSHGLVRENFAMSGQFNYVIAVAKVGDQQFLLDGTDRFIPIGVLPKRCLNGRARVISETNSRWVALDTEIGSEEIVNVNYRLDDTGNVSGTYEAISKGYDAFSSRRKYNLDGEEKYIENVQENHKTWEIDSVVFDEKSGLNDPFKRTYTIAFDEGADVAGNMLFVNPMFSEALEENYFKLEERMYPVDFGYTISQTYMLKLAIPEGYEVEESPEPTAIALPNKAGSFKYIFNQQGNEIQIVSIYKINKSLFPQTEYHGLKQFHDMIVAKHAEQIVLKKITE